MARTSIPLVLHRSQIAPPSAVDPGSTWDQFGIVSGINVGMQVGSIWESHVHFVQSWDCKSDPHIDPKMVGGIDVGLGSDLHGNDVGQIPQ
jgi:hypothetical protein